MKVLIAITMLVLGSTAFAGGIRSVPLTVESHSDGFENFTRVSGDQYSVRHSDNDVEMIGCSARHIAGVLPIDFGFCQARTSNNTHHLCITQNPELVKIISSASAYAYISFDIADATGECGAITFSTQSFYLPPLPDSNPGNNGNGGNGNNGNNGN